MILTCNKCSTRYLVAKNAIHKEGRTVKCTKCGHSWFEQAPQEEEIGQATEERELRAEPVPGGLGLSAMPLGGALPIIRVVRTPPSPFWLKILPVLLLLLLVMLGLVLYKDVVLRVVPELQPVYNVIGMQDTTGVMLKELSLREEEGGVYVQGKLVNGASNPRYMPLIRVTLLDEGKRAIGSQIIPLPSGVLAPASEFALESKLPEEAVEAGFVSVDVGNRIELLLR